jgi:hypothetical protein
MFGALSAGRGVTRVNRTVAAGLTGLVPRNARALTFAVWLIRYGADATVDSARTSLPSVV